MSSVNDTQLSARASITDREILERGATFIPLRDGKIPLYPGFGKGKLERLDASQRAGVFGSHSGNRGILTGGRRVQMPDGTFRGLVIVDIDVKLATEKKAAQQGVASFAKLEAIVGTLRDTLVCTTPSGGAHLYFWAPDGFAVSNVVLRKALGDDCGIEVQNDGQQCVFAGCEITPECAAKMGYMAGAYRWFNPDASIRELPTALIEYLRYAESLGSVGAKASAHGPSAPSATAVTCVPIADRNSSCARSRINDAIKYLSHAPISVRGNGGRTTMFTVCCVLVRKMRLPLDLAGDLLEAIYNPRLIAAGTTAWSRSTKGPHGGCIDERLESARDTGTIEPGDAMTEDEWNGPMFGGPRPQIAPYPAPVNDGYADQPAATESRVRVGVAWEDDLRAKLILGTKKESKVIVPSSANVATILQHHPDWAGVVSLNTFEWQIETTKAPPWHELDAPATPTTGAWTDADTARAAHWFGRTWIAGLPPMAVTSQMIDQALAVAAEANTRHPVREYLRGLVWDGVARVDHLAAYLGAEDSPYARAVGACFAIGAVARVMDPGCKLDTCLILEGAQGTFKSTAAAILGGKWFSDSKIPLGDKDAYQQLLGVWIYELGELAALSKADIETTKAFMSSATDRYRPSYGKHVRKVPRQVVFIGTTNATAYLHDTTGGRRYPPLKTGKIDTEALRRDRDLLWAEAVRRYDAGEAWHLSGDLAVAAAAQVEERYVQHPWEVSIAAYLIGREEIGVTTEEILAVCCVAVEHRSHVHAMTVGGILGRLGWVRRQQRIEGHATAREYRYRPKIGP